LLADDPSLDVRWTRKKSITRIILDSSASCLHPGARIFNREDPILVFHDRETSPPGDSPVAPNLEYCGIQREGRFLSWPRVLEELDRRKIRSVLVEGGGRVAGSLISQGLVDRMRLFYSPMFIGADGLPGIGELDTPVLADAFRFRITGTRRLDGDLLVEGTVDRE